MSTVCKAAPKQPSHWVVCSEGFLNSILWADKIKMDMSGHNAEHHVWWRPITVYPVMEQDKLLALKPTSKSVLGCLKKKSSSSFNGYVKVQIST